MESSIITSPILIALALALVLALVPGVWPYAKARKPRDEHHRSASAGAHHEPRSADGPRPR